MFSVQEMARLVDGDLLHSEARVPRRVIHDSRLVQPGDLFVALPGHRVDGRAFLSDAFERGACAALVTRPVALPDNARNVIAVENSVTALHRLATSWRDSLSATFVAITGTNGKTTVKALLGHLLKSIASTHISPQSYNTEVGLPIALLSMPVEAQFGVFELGAEQPGDIAALASILRPDWGVITSIGPGHLDGLRTLDAVAAEKWSLLEHLSEDGGAVVWAEAPQLLERVSSARFPILTAGWNQAEVTGKILRTVPDLEVSLGYRRSTLRCQLLGAHNANNVLLAATTANALGVDWDTIVEQIRSFLPIPQRLQAIPASFGTILDDSYNANPASTEAALRVLADYGPQDATRAFVFGSMRGLGDRTADYHRDIAQLALDLSVDTILPVGDAASAACQTFRDPRVIELPRDEVPVYVRSLEPPVIVLIKGSRAFALETLVDGLKTQGSLT